jgi:hypothetical protein
VSQGGENLRKTEGRKEKSLANHSDACPRFLLIDFTQFTLTALYAYSEAISRLQLLTGVELGIILCDSGSPAAHDPRMWTTTATSNFE